MPNFTRVTLSFAGNTTSSRTVGRDWWLGNADFRFAKCWLVSMSYF